jgi:hypothetical protein
MLVNRHWHNGIVGAPSLFDEVVVKSTKPLYTLTYLLSLSQRQPLDVIYSINVQLSSSAKLSDVSYLIAQHSHHIRHLHLQCLDWRYASSALEPLTTVEWPMVHKVEVMGFGLERQTHHMSFGGWDIVIFFDWVKKASKHRVIVQGGFVEGQLGEPNSTMKLESTVPDIAPQDPDFCHTWNLFADGPMFKTLHVSSLLDTPLVPIVTMLSTQSLPSLTTLHIHARFTRSNDASTATWMNLAANCASVQSLTLPYGADNILQLLKQDKGVWPVLTHLTFIRGPERLSPLLEMVVSRSRTGKPLHVVGLPDWESEWDVGELSELRRLLPVSLVKMGLQSWNT